MKKLCVLLLVFFGCGTFSYSQSVDTALVVKEVYQHLRFAYQNIEKEEPSVALLQISRTQDSIFIKSLNRTALHFILTAKPLLLEKLQELPESSFPTHASVILSIHFQFDDHIKLHTPSKKEVRAVARKLEVLQRQGQQVFHSPLVVTGYQSKDHDSQ